jgi:hypothetical protein
VADAWIRIGERVALAEPERDLVCRSRANAGDRGQGGHELHQPDTAVEHDVSCDHPRREHPDGLGDASRKVDRSEVCARQHFG